VQPEVSDKAGNPHHGQVERAKDAAQQAPQTTGTFNFSKSDLWIVLGAIGLILTGMLLGAGIMRLWMGHAASEPASSIAIMLSRALAKALL
jgi:hypothetical protein